MSNYTNEKFRNDLKRIGFPADENLDRMLHSVGKLNQDATMLYAAQISNSDEPVMVGMAGSVGNILDLIVNSTQTLINNVVAGHLTEGCTEYAYHATKQAVAEDVLDIIIDKLMAINGLDESEEDEILDEDYHLS